MEKRMFQILDEMNQNDGENNTATLGVCNAFIEARKAKGGGHVTMGVPQDILVDLLNQKKKPILLVIDIDEYKKIANNGK